MYHSFLFSDTGSDSDVNVLAHPLPECFNGMCTCPWGYSFDDRQNACLANNTPGYNYDIQGGGPEQTGNRIRESSTVVKCMSCESGHTKFAYQANRLFELNQISLHLCLTKMEP